MVKKANCILSEMGSFIWRDLGTQGKFKKNDKLSFIRDGMLIIGGDISSETHYVRVIDTRECDYSRAVEYFDATVP